MDRRRAIAVSGTVVVTATTATLAMALNLGLLGFDRGGATSLGSLTAKQPIELAAEEATAPTTAPAPEVEVRYEDVYVPAAPATSNDAVTDDVDHPADGTERVDEHDD